MSCSQKSQQQRFTTCYPAASKQQRKNVFIQKYLKRQNQTENLMVSSYCKHWWNLFCCGQESMANIISYHILSFLDFLKWQQPESCCNLNNTPFKILLLRFYWFCFNISTICQRRVRRKRASRPLQGVSPLPSLHTVLHARSDIKSVSAVNPTEVLIVKF